MDNKILIFDEVSSALKPRNFNNVKFHELFEILLFNLWLESSIRFFTANKIAHNPLKANTYIYTLLTGVLAFPPNR